MFLFLLFLFSLSPTALAESEKPVADFYSPRVVDQQEIGNEIGPSDVLSFIDNSTGSPTSWLWDFGDGSTSKEQNPIHVYGAMGGYTVTLTVENTGGINTTSKYGYVLVNAFSNDSERAGPAYFSSSAISGDAPFTVTFHDETGYAPYLSTWTFGDGSLQNFYWTATSDIPDANHTYLEPGQYTVALCNCHSSGITEITKYHYINVTGLTRPVASFTSEKLSVPKSLTIQFTDKSIGNPTSRFWDFGDGVSSTVQNPMHTYAAEGNYTINLTAVNENGTDSKLATIKVVKTNPYAYVTNYNSNTVSVIDITTNKVTATVPVGISPWGVAVSPDGTKVYVTNWNSNTVSVIDTATNTVTATVDVGSNPIGITVTPDGSKVYVANYYNDIVSVIDSANNTVIATVDVGSNPMGIAVTPDGKKVYVSKWFGVDVIDTAKNTVTEAVGVGLYPMGIAVSPDGSKVYLTHSYINYIDSLAVSVINTATNNITAILGVNGTTTGVVFNKEGTKAYVASWGSDNIYVIDTATNNVTAAIIVGIRPEGIAISPDGSTVYVANEDSNNISVIDTNTNAVTASINVGNKPVALGQFIASVPVQPLLPRANFSSNVAEGYAPLNVQFIDSSLNKNGWYWDFGDGTNSTDRNPIHTYSSSGNYSVNLTVSNGNSTDSKLAAIHVSEQLPIVSFSTNLTSGYAPFPVQFMDYSILNEPNSSSPPKQQVIAKVNNCTNISLKNGDTFYLRFYECPGCGLNWKFNFSPGLSVIDYNDNSNTHSEEPTPEGIMIRRIGGGEDCVWEIKAMTQGIQQVKSIPSEYIADTGYNFTLNITYLPQNITSGNWDFGDGTYSTEQNPTHIYFSAGNYTVKHKVTNAFGTDSKNATITVSEKPILPTANFSANDSTSKEITITVQGQSSSDDGSSSGGSSSGGGSAGGGSAGGGAGGSPESQSNVEAKEISQTFITSGNSVKFDFLQKATPVVCINFNSKKTAGRATTIAEMLKAKSTLVSGLPSDEVYKFFNLWVGNSGFATPNNIENAVVGFKVEKSWIKDKSIDKSSITLNRYSDKTWNQLPTSLSSETDTYLYLTAQTPGFSNFAITGNSIGTGTVQPRANKRQNPAVSETPNNESNGSTAANTQKTPEQQESPTPYPKQSTSLPGFEAVLGAAGLVAVFLYRSK